MRKSRIFASVAMVGLLATSVSTRVLQNDTKPSSDAQEAVFVYPGDEKAAATFAATCRDCHDAQTVTAHRRTQAGWDEVVAEMKDGGASVTEEAARVIVGYLTRRYGLVNINEAAADEIAAVLQLTANDSVAIVAFRAAKGPFADFDAVTKVPAVDVAKLRAARSFILYGE